MSNERAKKLYRAKERAKYRAKKRVKKLERKKEERSRLVSTHHYTKHESDDVKMARRRAKLMIDHGAQVSGFSRFAYMPRGAGSTIAPIAGQAQPISQISQSSGHSADVLKKDQKFETQKWEPPTQ